MRRRDDYRERSHYRAEAPTPITVDLHRGIIQRWRSRNAERRLARLLRPRNRRALAERLRRTANDPTNRQPTPGGLDVSVRDRAAAVRTELLEIAALLEHAYDPDPASVAEIGQLLANGASPLHDPDAHISELYAALYYVRAGLITQVSIRRPAEFPKRPQIQSPWGLNLPGEGNHRATAARNGQSHTPTPDACAEHMGAQPDPRPTPPKRHFGLVQRRRERRAQRKHTRLVSARNRRILARRLRLTASHATDRDVIRRRHDVLLHYRAAAVRTDLLEIAALLEHAPNPCPDCVAALRDLLTNGCDSPLYNADIHFSELQATLDSVRCGL